MSEVRQPSREDAWKAIKSLHKTLPPKTESSLLTAQRSTGPTVWCGKNNSLKARARNGTRKVTDVRFPHESRCGKMAERGYFFGFTFFTADFFALVFPLPRSALAAR